MTEPAVNPYEPTQSLTILEQPESLRFSGVIEPIDYQRMLPYRESEWWLYLVLAVLLGLFLAVIGPLGLLFALSQKRPSVVLGLFIFSTLISAGLWFLKGRIISSDRAARFLKLYPDVLGAVQGEFTSNGLAFCDGVHAYWFGPEYLIRTATFANGIRVQVDASAYRYLALSARMFDAFSLNSANQLKRHWQLQADTPVPTDRPFESELWNQISQPPADAIRFGGSASEEFSWRTPAFRNRAIVESGFWLLTIAGVINARHHLQTWMLWSSYLLLGYGLIINASNWRRYFWRTQQQSWYQSGWISPREFAICIRHLGVRMPLSLVAHKSDYLDHVRLTLRSGQSYSILRDMVETDEQWKQLCTLLLEVQSSKTQSLF